MTDRSGSYCAPRGSRLVLAHSRPEAGPRSEERGASRGRAAGFTLIELLIVIAIIGVVASVAVAQYRAARVRGSEASAIAGLRAIGDAQFAFSQACGKGLYAPSLVSLGTPMPTSGRGFLSPDLTLADPLVTAGYQITMGGTADPDAPQTCLGAPGMKGFQVTADPVLVGLSGNRFFGTNTDRVVFEDLESFTGNMPESGAPGHGTELR